MRIRLIMEIEYAGTDDYDEGAAHLSSFIHAAADSGMLTSEAMDAGGVTTSQVAAVCQRLEDPLPAPSAEDQWPRKPDGDHERDPLLSAAPFEEDAEPTDEGEDA